MEPTSVGSEKVGRVEDPIVGWAGLLPLHLSDLSNKQMADVYRLAIGTDPSVRKRSVMTEIIVRAVEKGVRIKYSAEPYVWCFQDSARQQRIALSVCRARQRAGDCASALCENRITERNQKMGKKKKSEDGTLIEAGPLLPKAPTKSDLLRSAFDEKEKWTLEELLDRTGYDTQNLKTAMGIMRNPGRTKPEQLMNILFDRDEEVYYKAEIGEKTKPKTKPADPKADEEPEPSSES